MRTNYTAEIIAYEMDKDRSRVYMAPSSLRESRLKPGQHVKISFNGQETILKIVPKFDGDENAVYLPREELAHLAGNPGDLLSVIRAAEEYSEAEEVVVVFKRIRKTVERLEALRLMLTDKSIVSHGEVVFGGRVQIKKAERVKVTENTKIKIETEEQTLFPIGLKDEAEEIKRFIDLVHSKVCTDSLNRGKPLSKAEDTGTREQTDTSNGLIVAGEAGMGKRTLCLFILQETGKEWVRVHGNAPKSIEDSFEYAKINEPCTIWIDRIDRYLEEKEIETVVCLEKILDEIRRDRRRIALIATVSDPNKIPKELKGANMLDRIVSLHAPTLAQREAQILASFSQHRLRMQCSVETDGVGIAAKRTAGFTRGEIYLLMRDSLNKLSVPDAKEEEKSVDLEKAISSLTIRAEAGKKCDGQCLSRVISNIIRVVPSASEEAPAEVPDIRFSSIFGQDEAKEKLKEAVIWPVVHGDIFEEVGISPPKGVLLYGPPGCGKTLIAQALANESGAVFLSIRGPEIMGKYVGESEERVRKVFARARSQTPSIIFIDEIDSIAPHREAEGGQVDKRVVSTLLTEMDGVGSAPGVFVLGATNKPWSIDSALMRPGRFDCHVLVDLPKKDTRKEIIISRLVKTIQAVERWQGKGEERTEASALYEYFADRTEGFTGAELKGLCTDISMEAVRHKIEKSKEDILAKLKKVVERTHPRIPQSEVEVFRMFSKDSSKVSTGQIEEQMN